MWLICRPLKGDNLNHSYVTYDKVISVIGH